jgi:sporulation protein YlmC with PRC-barrel domain
LLMFASEIKGFLVYSKDMVSLGKVKDVEFDPSEMKVTNIIVDFEKKAAKEVLGKRVVLRHAKGRVPVTAIESIKDALNLARPWKDLKGVFTSL